MQCPPRLVERVVREPAVTRDRPPPRGALPCFPWFAARRGRATLTAEGHISESQASGHLLRALATGGATVLLTTTLTSQVAAEEAAPPGEAVAVWAQQFGREAGQAIAALKVEAANLQMSPNALATLALEQAVDARRSVEELESTGMQLVARPEVDAELGTSVSRGKPSHASKSRKIVQARSTVSTDAELSYSAEDPYVAAERSGGGDGTSYTPLKAAKYREDFFYYPVSTLGINHGHVGLYRWPGQIIEAANAEWDVRKILVEDRKVPDDKTYIFYVDTTFAKQQNAADWANTKNGEKYRHWSNTKNKFFEAPWNCSQLIWAAYGKQDIWLDYDNGDYVWPADIVNENRTKAYDSV